MASTPCGGCCRNAVGSTSHGCIRLKPLQELAVPLDDHVHRVQRADPNDLVMLLLQGETVQKLDQVVAVVKVEVSVTLHGAEGGARVASAGGQNLDRLDGGRVAL